ncbi:unnamed protein product [Urochloa decumbens]|uniref:Protein kinase domain-containing protein n=1 Tax=Urochloa decumbens TaxID=240449 RepID=A0ABC8VY97_9POAL
MELCIRRQWRPRCTTGSILLVFIVLALLLLGAAVAFAVRRLCCASRPVRHAADDDEEAAAEDRSKKDFSIKLIRIFAVVTGQQVLGRRDDPKSIPPTMVRSPAASPEPARSRRSMSRNRQATPIIISQSPPSVPSSQNQPSSSEPLSDISPALQRSLREYSYLSLDDATGGFDSRNQLGRGESGVIYAGDLLFDNGLIKKVAIKQFHKNFVDDDSKQVREDLTQKKHFLQHRNLVTLFGYCLHDGRLFLVYDRMDCDSLLDYKLFSEEGAAAAKPVLTLALPTAGRECHNVGVTHAVPKPKCSRTGPPEPCNGHAPFRQNDAGGRVWQAPVWPRRSPGRIPFTGRVGQGAPERRTTPRRGREFEEGQ